MSRVHGSAWYVQTNEAKQSGRGLHRWATYAIDADAGTIFGWAVSSEGSLAPLRSWPGLPVTTAGLAVC